MFSEIYMAFRHLSVTLQSLFSWQNGRDLYCIYCPFYCYRERTVHFLPFTLHFLKQKITLKKLYLIKVSKNNGFNFFSEMAITFHVSKDFIQCPLHMQTFNRVFFYFQISFTTYLKRFIASKRWCVKRIHNCISRMYMLLRSGFI